MSDEIIITLIQVIPVIAINFRVIIAIICNYSIQITFGGITIRAEPPNKANPMNANGHDQN